MQKRKLPEQKGNLFRVNHSRLPGKSIQTRILRLAIRFSRGRQPISNCTGQHVGAKSHLRGEPTRAKDTDEGVSALGQQWRAQFLFVILIGDSCDRDAWWQLIMIMRMICTWPPDASKQPGPLQADQSEIGGLEATPYDPGFGSRNDRKKRLFWWGRKYKNMIGLDFCWHCIFKMSFETIWYRIHEDSIL